MLRDFLWNTFENTGNIEAYLVLKEMVENKATDQEEIIEDEVAISK